jgi:hypothetical protein
MNPSTLRRLLLAAAFVTAVVSAALVPGDVSPPKRVAKSSPPAVAVSPASRAMARDVEVPPLLAFRRTLEEGVDVVDIFEARSPPSAAGPAAKPVPPRMPFAFVGQIEESGRPKAVLAEGNNLHYVAKGEEFAGSYRLEEIGADQAVVTYIPLDARQTVTSTPAPGTPGTPAAPGMSRGAR